MLRVASVLLFAARSENVLDACSTCTGRGGRYCGPQLCDSTGSDCPLLMTVLPKIDQCKREQDYLSCMKDEGPKYVELIGPPNVARAFAQAGKLNNKPYYRSPEGDVLFYYPDEDYWVVSAKLGGKSAKAYAMADEGENPIDATEWYIHTPDGFTKDAMVRVVKAGPDAVRRASGAADLDAPKQPQGGGFSPFQSATVKNGPVGVVAKDGSGGFSPFGRRPPDGPVGVRPKDGSAFSPFGPATVKEGPVGVVPKDGSGSFSPFGRRPPDGPVGVRPKDGSA